MNYSPTSSTLSLSPTIDSLSFKNNNDGIVYPPTPPLDASDAADAVFPYVPTTAFGRDGVASPPQAIPGKAGSFIDRLITPPLTPEEDGPLAETRSVPAMPDDALEFLSTLFPKDGVKALPHARKVSISAPNLGVDFDGVVLALPNEPKTFYVDGKSAASVNLRER
jgi:hypothetical protein